MNLPLTDILLSDAAAKAICWTLVHSLWQGILAAILAGVVIGSTRRRTALLRYNLLAADGLLFLLAAGATFYYEMGQAADQVKAGPSVATSGAAGGSMAFLRQEMQTQPLTSGNMMQQTGDYLNAHAGIITMIWLACLTLQLVRLTGGLSRLSRIRLHSLPTTGEYWNERLQALSRQLGIGRTVILRQSRRVEAPSVFGWLKPSILVPLGMLAQLPPDQVETILLHELAHIRRGDYLVNLLLHLTEAIFFFNPGMRWIASLIRREREACCDDIVLSGTADRSCYFEALVAFSQWVADGQAAGGRSYALQLGGGRTDLLWRIKRMLNQENKKLQVMEKAILSFGLMALVSVSLISMRPAMKAAMGGKAAVPATKKVAGPAVVVKNMMAKDTAPHMQRDTFPGKKINFSSFSSQSNSDNGRVNAHMAATDEEGNRYVVNIKDGEVVLFRLNGELIPREGYGRYSNVLASLEAARKNIPKPPAPPAPATLQTPPTSPTLQTPSTPAAPPTPPTPPVWSLKRSYHAPTPDSPLVYSRVYNPYIERIVEDMMKEGLIDNINRFSFTLNGEELIVNGTIEPGNIYSTFRTKYIINPMAYYIYSQYYTPQGSGSHSEVNPDPDGKFSI